MNIDSFVFLTRFAEVLPAEYTVQERETVFAHLRIGLGLKGNVSFNFW